MSNSTSTNSDLSNPITLISLLPSSYRLIYALPLLLLSLVLTFAGAFLALDRTRSFSPSKDVQHKIKKFWVLEGGIGGLVLGWMFGMNLATWIVLVVLNNTSARTLGKLPFLFIWLIAAIIFTLISGRWRIATLVFFSLFGGAALALIVAVIFHPALLTRLVLLAIFVIAFLTSSLIPYPRYQRLSIRITSALTGSVTTIMSICIFSGISSWGDVWLRLVIKTSANWEGGQEQGLSAATCILFIAGCASDWALRWKFGEDPDRDWDAYLANYSSNFPTSDYRAGTFKPFQSFWARIRERLLSRGSAKSAPILFPSDADLHAKPSHVSRDLIYPVSRPAPVKFRPVDEGLSDSDDDGDLGKPKMLRVSTNFSERTAVDHERMYLTSGKKSSLRNEPEESDEEDRDDGSTAASKSQTRLSRERSNRWKPGFLRRHHASLRRGRDIEEGLDEDVKSLSEHAHRDPLNSPPPAPGLVPATPSLIYALDRVARAQRVAYGVDAESNGSGGSSRSSRGADSKAIDELPLSADKGKEEDNEAWRDFWKEVEGKAAIEERSAT